MEREGQEDEVLKMKFKYIENGKIKYRVESYRWSQVHLYHTSSNVEVEVEESPTDGQPELPIDALFIF